MKRTCQYCKTSFEASRKDKHYCNATCRQNAYVYRKAEVLAGIEPLTYQNVSTPSNTLTDMENTKEELKAFIYSTIRQAMSELKLPTHQNVLTGNNVLEAKTDKVKETKPVSQVAKEAETLSMEAITELLEKDHQNVLTENLNQSIPLQTKAEDIMQKEKEYKHHRSEFLCDVQELLDGRDFFYQLLICYRESKPLKEDLDWVNVRLRCLVEAILTISEKNEIPPDDLIDIANAFTLIIKSAYYQKLPATYPYLQSIKTLRDKIRDIYLQNEEADIIKLSLKKELKIELLATRCELRSYVPKKSFNQLIFQEAPEQKTREPDPHPKQEKKENKTNYYESESDFKKRLRKKGLRN